MTNATDEAYARNRPQRTAMQSWIKHNHKVLMGTSTDAFKSHRFGVLQGNVDPFGMITDHLVALDSRFKSYKDSLITSFCTSPWSVDFPARYLDELTQFAKDNHFSYNGEDIKTTAPPSTGTLATTPSTHKAATTQGTRTLATTPGAHKPAKTPGTRTLAPTLVDAQDSNTTKSSSRESRKRKRDVDMITGDFIDLLEYHPDEVAKSLGRVTAGVPMAFAFAGGSLVITPTNEGPQST